MSKVKVDQNAADFIYMDDIHQPTHDKNLWNARMKRDTAASGIPEWEQMRDLASQIKEHTLTHLDHYVQQFVTEATKRGVIVHFAKDDIEHNQTVYDILKSHHATKIVKSKSMLQEECEMGAFLEARGSS